MTFIKGSSRSYVSIPKITQEQEKKITRMWFSKFDYNSVSFIAQAAGISEKRLKEFVEDKKWEKRRRPMDRA